MIFDTGAFTTTVDDRAVERLGLHVEQGFAGYIDGVGGSEPFSIVSARSVRLDGLLAQNFKFAAANTGALRSIADGLLSSDVLSRFDMDLDFPAGRLILYEPAGQCSRPTVFLDAPVYAVPLEPFGAGTRTPRIIVRIAGQSFVAAIDTGAPATVMTSVAASRLGLRISDLRLDRQGVATGVGPSAIRVMRHVFEPVTIGDLTINNMPVGILDQAALGGNDMLLGLDFQTRVHLWVSNSSRTLVVQYPPKPSPRSAQ